MKIKNSVNTKSSLDQALFYCQTNEFAKAKSIYIKLLKTSPKNYIALTNLGTIELQDGNFEKGISYLETSIAINDDQPSAINNLANGLFEIKRYDVALNKIQMIEHLDFTDAHYNKGRILKALREFDKAIEAYDKALKLNPNYILAYINRGLIFHDLGQYENAIKSYQEAIQINATCAEAFFNCGLTYFQLNQYENAIKSYENAFRINPNYVEAYCNLAIIYESMSRSDVALDLCYQAIQVNANYADAYYNCGVIYTNLKNYESAITAYKKAIQINSNYAEALVNLALIKLNLKDFKEGWLLFEKRFMLDSYKIKNIDFIYNQTNLNTIKISKKILLINEQGIGDQILYMTMLPVIEKYGPSIDILLDKKLICLLQASFPKINFIAIGTYIDISTYENVIPMGCLGGIVRKTEKDFEGQPKSILRADHVKIKYYIDKFKIKKKKLCGISWKSQNEKIGKYKSINIEELIPIFRLPDIEFINLQYGDVDSEIKIIKDKYQINIHSQNKIDLFNDIDELAALISSLDFVVTSSNVNAHLAGALGKKTYLLAPYSLGKIWYWHDGDKKSIWYPSIDIYRQEKNGDWEMPIMKIKKCLELNK